MSRVLNCIVAVCPDMGIGNNGNLPWHPKRLNNEFKHFQKMTMTSSVEGKVRFQIFHIDDMLFILADGLVQSDFQLVHSSSDTVAMWDYHISKVNRMLSSWGRKTWFSIPERNRPLKNRINIVLSRELKEPPAGAHQLASDFCSALRLLDTAEMAERVDQVWVIGGSSLYEEMMESQGSRRLFVTRILQQFKSDTFLPEINQDKYRLLPEFPGVPQDLQEEAGVQYRFEVYESIDQ